MIKKAKKLFKQRPKLFYGLILFIVLISLFGIKLWSDSRPVKGAWFNTQWAYRQRFPISNTSGSAQNNFQTQITLNTSSLISSGKMLSTCNDLRVTNSSGKQLPFWIEPTTCNTTSTLIWVNIDSIPTTGVDIYLYYGNPSASSGQSSTNQVFITDMVQASAGWPLDDTTSTQSYARAVNAATSTGRNIVNNSTPTSGTSWTLNSNWAYTTNSFQHTSGSTQSVNQNINPGVTIGRAYSVSYIVSGMTTGTITVSLGSTNGTARSANGTYTETIIPAGTNISFAPSSTFDGSISNFSVTELNISSSTATPTQLLTDGNMEAAGTAAWTSLAGTTASKQTSTPHGGSQVLRVARNGSSPFDAGQNVLTAGQVYRVQGFARSDGSATAIIRDNVTNIWVGSTSTTWQPFDFVFVAGSTLINFGGTGSGTQYTEYDDVTVSLDTGIRSDSILSTLDGDMEQSGTSYWAIINSATLAKDAVTFHDGTQSLKITYNGVGFPGAQQAPLVTGKTYQVTGWAMGDGTALPFVADGTGVSKWTGTTSASWQRIDATFLATNTGLRLDSNASSAGHSVWFDSIVVTEVDPLVGLTANGVTVGAAANGHLTNAYSFDGTNDFVNIYSGSLNSAFNAPEGTLVAWAKVSGSGIWSDGLTHLITRIGRVDGNNRIDVSKTGTNTISAVYVAGGITSNVTTSTSTTNWFMVTLTWSKSNDQFKMYLNGAQVGSTVTGLGTWSGNFGNVNSIIGDASTTPGFQWSGLINDVRLYNYALTPIQIADQYNASYDTQNYTTANDAGHELVRKYNTSVTVGAAAAEEVGAGSILNWHLDEGTGTNALDASSNQNNGTLGGTTVPSWQTESNCVINKCLLFDGQSSKITGTKTASNIQTVAFWVYPTDITSRGIMNLDGGTHKISLSSSGVVNATGFSSPTYYVNGTATTNPVLSLNQWQYVEITTATPFSSTSSFTVGTDGTTFFQGNLDEIKFFNYARSASQALTNYNSVGNLLGQARQFGPNGLIANWGLQDTTSTQSYASVSNVGQSLGRNTLIDGDMETSGTSNWSATTATLTKQITNPHGGTQVLRVARNGAADASAGSATIMTNGRAFLVTGYTRSDGNATPTVRVNNVVQFTGTTSTSWQQFSFNVISTVNGGASLVLRSTSTVDGQYAEFDDVSVQELNIPSSSTTPVQLLTDGNMETSGTAAWTAVASTLSKQSGSVTGLGGSQVLRVNFVGGGAVAQQTILTVGQVYRITGYERSDGTSAPRIAISGSGLASGLTTSTTWEQFDFVVVATGTSIQFGVNSGSGYTEWDDITVSPDTGIRSDSILAPLDGDMEQSGTSYWTAVNSATLTKDASTPHGGSQDLKVAYNGVTNPAADQSVLVLGKTYHITGWVKGDGTAVPRILINNGSTVVFTGTSSTTYQSFDITVTPSATNGLLNLQAQTSTSSTFAEFDDITVNEIDPLSGVNTNGVTVGAAANGHFTNAYSFDGSNDTVNIYSGSLNSTFNPNEGTAVVWFKVNGAGVWTDATARRLLSLRADANNFLVLDKSGTNNTLIGNYEAGGVSTSVTIGSQSSTNWVQVVLTWSASANQFRMFVNAIQVGSTQTGLGTWIGNLGASNVTIGASNTSGNSSWSGLINDVRLYNHALSPNEISQLYNFAPGPVAYYKMDEGSGTSANDSSGNGNTGTITSATNSSWVSGKYGKALNFVRANGNKINITDPGTSSFDLSSGMTIGFWVNPSNMASSIDQYIVNKANAYFIALRRTFQSNLDFRLLVDGSFRTYSPTVNISANTWSYISAIYDNNSKTMTVYVNGVSQGTTVLSGLSTYSITTNDQTFEIGSAGGSSGFDGTLDDLKIYNYARTQSQILDDMNGGQNANNLYAQGNSLPKPVDYWKFNEGYGTTTNNSGIDSTETGTLNSATWLLNNNCKSNNCVNISANTNNVSFGDVSYVDSLTQLTTDFWINPQTLGTSKMILSKANTTTQRVFAIQTDSSTNSEIRVFISSSASDTSNFCKTTGLGLTTGTWQHLAIVYDGTVPSITVYKNGVPITCTVTGTIPSSLVSGTTSNLKLGQGDDSTPTALLAFYDDLRIYNTALSQSQILLDRNGGLSQDFGTRATPEANQLNDTAGNPPVAYWNFDEGTGTTANDSSGNSRDLSSFQGTVLPTWSSGKLGKGLFFVAATGTTGSRATYPSSWAALGGTTGNAITVSAWVKPSATQTNPNNSYIIRSGGGTDENYGISLTTPSSGIFKVKATYYDGTTFQTLTTTNNIVPANTWSYVTVVFTQGTNVSFYLNGNFQQTISWIGANSVTTATSTAIGFGGASAQSYDGYIDDVKIYNYARTQGQISYDYNRGGPIGWWKFDECSGTTANDSSGNGNALTINIGGSGTQTSAGTCNTSGTAWGNGASGKFNNSLNFDGNDDYAACTDANCGGTNKLDFGISPVFSFGAWIKTTTSGAQVFMSKKSTTAAGTAGYLAQLSSGNTAVCRISDGTTQVSPTAILSGALNDGNWHFIMCVASGTTLKIYVDGSQENNSISTSVTGTLDNTSDFRIGNEGDGATSFNGQVDDARVYNYALSLTQVQKIYNDGFSTFYGPSTGTP